MRFYRPLHTRLGASRTRTAFALFPTRINDTTVVWLERYFVEERCINVTPPRDRVDGLPQKMAWVVHEKRLFTSKKELTP